MGRERAVQARQSEPGNRRALSVARYSYGAGHFSNICSERPERAAAISSDAEAQIDSPRGEGDSLPESARHFFDPRFGFDFSRVRVHTDSRAAEAGHAASTLTLRRPSSAGPKEKRDAPVKPLKKPVMGRADNEDAVEREADASPMQCWATGPSLSGAILARLRSTPEPYHGRIAVGPAPARSAADAKMRSSTAGRRVESRVPRSRWVSGR